MNNNIEQYAQVLMMAADLLDTLNKRKKEEELTAVANELRKIATELLNKETDKVQKSANLITILINFIKNLFK